MEGNNRNISSLCLILLLGFPLLAFCHTKTKVTSLPRFNGPLPFDLETGYVGVEESKDVLLFYYFVKSERSPKDDPLLFWFMGGHGRSGFSALVYELGDYFMDSPWFKNNKLDSFMLT